jgi:hypothetical protein
LKFFLKPIAKRYRREKIYQRWKKRSSKEPIPYPKFALLRIPTIRRFPELFQLQCSMAKFASAYRCGAVLDFHQVPF